jgi:hypothetical protein
MPWEFPDPVKGYLRHVQERREPKEPVGSTLDELTHFSNCEDWNDVRDDFFAKYGLHRDEVLASWLSTDGSKQQPAFWDYAYGDQGPQRLTSFFTHDDASVHNLNHALLNHIGSNFPATLATSKAPGASQAPPRWLTKYLETVIEHDDFIRSQDFFDKVCSGVVGDVTNVWKGRYPVLCWSQRRDYPANKEVMQSSLKGLLDSYPLSQKFVLLSAGYDIHPTGSLETLNDSDCWEKLMNDSRLIAWYGHQTIAVHPKLHNFPLGVTAGNKPQGIAALLQRFRTEGYPQKTHKLLVNFGSITNCMREQLAVKAKTVWPFASVLPSPSLGLKLNPITGRFIADVTHLTTMAKFRFALSPHGVGADCYRTWEALYIGTIPIVLRTSDSFDRVYSDLPVLLVDSLNDINETMLDQVWDDFQAKTFNFERLSMKFWAGELHGF